jgi:diaminohydroxyphosphoribosylaminopyrimidine deaminase / 5-amino-6-(5-phosphoribosylamino)uracil reductase
MYMNLADYTRYMREAIELAEQGRGTTNPNPMVGAIIIDDDGSIISKGYHKKAGEAHAEVNAIKAAHGNTNGKTMVVTLEPCNHYGRTPPCTKAIIKAGLGKVIVGMIDPNPKCAGGGVKMLRDAGIDVEYGLLSDEVAVQNEVFIKYISTSRPFVVVKVAISLDGKISEAPEQQTRITGEEAHQRVHEMRNQHDAIMVGIGTVLADNPLLTTRLEAPDVKNPLRVIVDSHARLPLHSKIAETANDVPTLLATTTNASSNHLNDLELTGVQMLKLYSWDGSVDLDSLMEELGSRHVTSVMVEGGAKLVASLTRAKLIDKYVFFIAPKLIGKPGVDLVGGALDTIVELQIGKVEKVGADLMVEAYPKA